MPGKGPKSANYLYLWKSFGSKTGDRGAPRFFWRGAPGRRVTLDLGGPRISRKMPGKGLGNRPFRVKSLEKAAKSGSESGPRRVSRGDSSAAAASPGDRWGGRQKAAKCVKKASENGPFARKMPGKSPPKC